MSKPDLPTEGIDAAIEAAKAPPRLDLTPATMAFERFAEQVRAWAESPEQRQRMEKLKAGLAAVARDAGKAER